MSVIRSLLDLVQASVSADFGEDTISYADGELQAERFAGPPRIEWVEGDTCAWVPTDRPGGNGRALWKRVIPLQAKVWGRSDVEVVLMMVSIIQAFTEHGEGSFRPLSDERPEPEDNRDQGFMRVLNLEVDTVVAEKEYLIAYADRARFDASRALPGDGKLDALER